MNEFEDADDAGNNRWLFLPRPWLEVDPKLVRERGPLAWWSCGERTYVKGLVGCRVLPYWHRVIAVPGSLATEVASPRRVVIPM